jgi:hypothetical protein
MNRLISELAVQAWHYAFHEEVTGKPSCTELPAVDFPGYGSSTEPLYQTSVQILPSFESKVTK